MRIARVNTSSSGRPFLNKPLARIMTDSGTGPGMPKQLPSDSPSPGDDAVADVLHVLVVEDNPADLFLIREIIGATGIAITVHVARDGELATRFLDDADRDASAPCPAMVILDINLPKKRGTEVLAHLRRSPRCRNAPAIVVSTSKSDKDREEVIQGGANAYFRKSSDYDEFAKLTALIQELLALFVPRRRSSDLGNE